MDEVEEQAQKLKRYFDDIADKMHRRLDQMEEHIQATQTMIRENEVVQWKEFGPANRRLEDLEEKLDSMDDLHAIMQAVRGKRD